MARASGGRGDAGFSPQFPEGEETKGQVIPMFAEPKGIDRFHESTRIGPNHAVRIRNLMFEDGILVSRLGTDLMGGNAASKVMQVIDLIRKGEKKVTLRFCTRHLEIFEYGLRAWRSFPIPLTGNEDDFFAYTFWADKLLFSNGVDGLWEFDFKLMEAKLVPGGPSAKHLTTFGNRVVASSTVENAEDYPLRVRWSVKNKYNDWTGIGSGFEDRYGSPGGATDEAMGVFPFSDEQAWLVRSRSVEQMSVSGNAQAPFRFSRILSDVGTPFRHTICSVPAGIVFASRDNIHFVSGGGHQLIGLNVIDDIIDEVETLNGSYAAYDFGRQEYRLAIDSFVWRYRFLEEGWTSDEYPWLIKSLGRQIQGVAGIPIDNLSGIIDELVGSINSLVYDRGTDDAMMFVPFSSELSVVETDEPRDVLLTGEETDSEIQLVTGVMNLRVDQAIELHEIQMEYVSEMEQQLIFEYTQTDGQVFLPLSLKDVETTDGSEILFVKAERVSRKLQTRLRSLNLGKLRILGLAPTLVKVSRSMARKKPRPATIEILPSTLSLTVGGTQQLSIRVLAVDGTEITGLNVTLVSSNNSIATVSSTGVVRALAEGNFSIVASVRNIQAVVTGTVIAAAQAPVASVVVLPTVSDGVAGSQQQFTATLRDANSNILVGRTVTWASSAPSFATVDNSGLVTLVAAGTAVISATSEGVTGNATLTVTAAADVVATVEVSPSTFAGDVGESIQLQAFPKNAGGTVLSGKTIAWSTDNASVATVNATGLVSLVGAGSVTITATCETIPGTSVGTVTAADVPVATVTVAPGSFSIAAGATQALTATTKDSNGNVLTGRPISWSSSNTAVASVDQNGLVTGIAAGNATITASSEGKSGTSAGTITAVPVASVTIDPVSFNLNAGSTIQLTATPRDSLNNPLTGRIITWGSSDVTKATVSNTGLVTGIAAGSVTISATCETKIGNSTGTIGAASYSSVSSNSGVHYIPEPQVSDANSTLPQVTMYTTYGVRTKTGAAISSWASTVTLTDTGSSTQNRNNLQAAIDAAAARAGHSKIRLNLPYPLNSGVACRKHTAGDFVTYIEATTLPATEFNRAAAASMTNSPNLLSTNSAHSLQFDRGASGYRFVGLKFTSVPKTTTSVIYHLVPVFPKESSTEYQTVLADQVSDVVFDRCLFQGNDDGTGIDNGNVRDGIVLNGSYVAVIDSDIQQIGWTGNESHGILCFNAPGPVKIVNNRIEATSIGTLFGGVKPPLGSAGRPSDIEIRHNYFTRRMQWAKNDAAWDGVNGRGIKNQLEFKNANRVLVEGNIFENNWADAQSGMIVIVKSGTGDGVSASGCGTENVTIRHNIARNSVRCWNFAAKPDEQDAVAANRCVLYNNLAYDIGAFAGQSLAPVAWLIAQPFHDLFIAHNTLVCNIAASTFQLAYANAVNQAQRFVYRDNLTEFAYVWSDSITGTLGIQNWAANDYIWERNVTVMPPANWGIHPGGTNQYDDVRTDIGFVNLAGDDYHLAVGSPYKGDGDNGSDPGCDVDKVLLATSGVAP